MLCVRDSKPASLGGAIRIRLDCGAGASPAPAGYRPGMARSERASYESVGAAGDASSAVDDPVVVVCVLCGIAASGPTTLWMFGKDRSGSDSWYCPDCARENLRSVEAKLDRQWW